MQSTPNHHTIDILARMCWADVRPLLVGQSPARLRALRDTARMRAWLLETEGQGAERIQRYTALAELARRLQDLLSRRPG
jgi:hypothetical protein